MAKKKTKAKAKAPAAERAVYHVTPSPKGGWQLLKEGNARPVKKFERKVDAVAAGKILAKKPALGQIIIHKQDGKIQTEYTYGDDPRRSKG